MSPGNNESVLIQYDGGKLMSARGADDLLLIPKCRKFRRVAEGGPQNPTNATPLPSKGQVGDITWFFRGSSLIEIGFPTITPYPKL